MLIRIVIGIIVLFAILAVLRRIKATLNRTEQPRVIEAKTTRCALCGVYFPRNEGVTGGGREYCSQAHADQDGVA